MKTAALAGAILIGAAATSAVADDPQNRGGAAVPRATEESWRVWGGPQRDFNATATGLFRSSGEKWLSTAPRKLWERALGDGYSAIAVEDGILYTGYRWDTNDVVMALEAGTGKPVWEFSYRAPFTIPYSDAVGPGPCAMLQVIGVRVVTARGS